MAFGMQGLQEMSLGGYHVRQAYELKMRNCRKDLDLYLEGKLYALNLTP